MERFTWLRVSIFSAQENWALIVKAGIAKYLVQHGVQSFLIKFNYLSGENIRFAVLSPVDHREEIAKGIDQYFKNFFSSADLITKETPFPPRGLFLPFPQNTIQYGLYMETSATQADTAEIKFSEIMLAAFEEAEIVDDETILIFTLYLNMAMVKMLRRYVAEDTMFYELFSSTRKHELNTLDVDMIAEKYSQTRDAVQEIFHDILLSDKSERELPWLTKWMELCETTYRHVAHVQPEVLKAPKIAKYTLHKLMIDHLGLSENMNVFAEYFANRILQENLQTSLWNEKLK